LVRHSHLLLLLLLLHQLLEVEGAQTASRPGCSSRARWQSNTSRRSSSSQEAEAEQQQQLLVTVAQQQPQQQRPQLSWTLADS
jgi:hypothetical protein